MKYILICPNCGKVYRADSEAGDLCPHCGTKVVYSGFTEEAFDQLPPEKQQQLVYKLTGKSAPTAGTDSGWISLLDMFVNLALVICLLASVVGGFVLMANVGFFIGLMVLLGGVVVTLLSVGIVKVLLGAAKDLHFIRSCYERRH